mmetsp:Transcript_13389/g.25135  ORF Transcript_13389/g.25135 Transcript_13389/m.25135 type:complete len:299 (-) Transcript_13389:59-955(-)
MNKDTKLKYFVETGMQYINTPTFHANYNHPDLLLNADLSTWKKHFGVCPRAALRAWNMIKYSAVKKTKGTIGLPHYFMVLKALKTAPNQTVMANLAGCTEKTFRKYFWLIVDLLADSASTLVQWSNRKINCARADYPFKISVDGVDFRIKEPIPFDPKWYSHKFNGSGVRYEIALAIYSDNIVWFSGPYPCGEESDLHIFKHRGLQSLLKMANERCIADGTYKTSQVSGKGKGDLRWRNAKNRIRARHETINKRLKTFSVIGNIFTFDKSKHGDIFSAILTLVQLSLKIEPLMKSFDD